MSVVRFPGSNGKGGGPLSDPNLDLAMRLGLVLQAVGIARRELEEAEDALKDLFAPERAEPSAAAVASARTRVHATYARWQKLTSDADELAERARRARTTTDFAKVYSETLRHLKSEFDGGPHYDLLCERVAGLHMRLKEMERAGRAYPPAEHARLNAQLLAFINQLQKYTETMKSESISKEAQGVAEKILLIVEKNLAVSHPELWRGVMREVRQALESAA